jgi:hypothetical protein
MQVSVRYACTGHIGGYAYFAWAHWPSGGGSLVGEDAGTAASPLDTRAHVCSQARTF